MHRKTTLAGVTLADGMPPALAGAQDPPVDPPADPPGGGPPAGDPPADPPKMVDQAEVDRIVQQRLERQRAQFGGTPDEIKERLKKLDDLEAASLSEKERLEKERDDFKEAAQTATQRAHDALIQAAVVAEASKAGAINPAAVVKLLDKSSLTVGDDGQVEGVEEAVTALLEAETYLVGTPPMPNPGPGGGGPRNTPPSGDLDSQLSEAQKAGDWPKVRALNAKKAAALRERVAT